MFEYIKRYFDNEIDNHEFKQAAIIDHIPLNFIDFVIAAKEKRAQSFPELPAIETNLTTQERYHNHLRSLSRFLIHTGKALTDEQNPPPNPNLFKLSLQAAYLLLERIQLNDHHHDDARRATLICYGQLLLDGYVLQSVKDIPKLKDCYIVFNNLYTKLSLSTDEDKRLFVQINMAITPYFNLIHTYSTEQAKIEFHQHSLELAGSINNKNLDDYFYIANLQLNIAQSLFNSPDPQFAAIKRHLRQSIDAFLQAESMDINLLKNILSLYKKTVRDTANYFILIDMIDIFSSPLSDINKLKKRIDRIFQTVLNLAHWQDTRELVSLCIQIMPLLYTFAVNDVWHADSAIACYFKKEELVKAYLQQIEALKQHPVMQLELFLDGSTIPLVAAAKQITALQQQVAILQNEVSELKSALASRPLQQFGIFNSLDTNTSLQRLDSKGMEMEGESKDEVKNRF